MIYLFIFVLGLLIGSFLNVVIIRLPQLQSVVFPSSHCVKCKTPLKWWHNIPLLSWLFLRGRCHYCKEPISIQYPLVELLSGIIFVSVYYKMGISIYSAATAAVFILLLALSVIDLKYKAVPDSLNLLALTISFFTREDILSALHDALVMMGAFSLLRFYVSYYVSKKEEMYLKRELKKAPWLRAYYPKYIMIEAMGEGDIIVAGALGALLGIKLTLVAIFLAALTALPASILQKALKSDKELPFIPFLALGGYLSFMFGEQILKLAGIE